MCHRNIYIAEDLRVQISRRKEHLLIRFSLWKWCMWLNRKISLDWCLLDKYSEILFQAGRARGFSVLGVSNDREVPLRAWGGKESLCGQPAGWRVREAPQTKQPTSSNGLPSAISPKEGLQQSWFLTVQGTTESENTPAPKHRRRQTEWRCRHSQTPLSVKAEDDSLSSYQHVSGEGK